MRCKTLLTIVIVVVFPTMSHAIKGEAIAGLYGGLAFPSFSSESGTAFALTTWTAGVHGGYGIIDDLYLTVSFGFMMFNGRVDDYTYEKFGLEYRGTLRTSAKVYLPELGLKWRFYGGYNFSPYLEASVGYGWATYTDSAMYNNGNQFDVEVSDFSEGFITMRIGVSVDYRIEETVFVGLGVMFTYDASSKDLLHHHITVPVHVSYYW